MLLLGSAHYNCASAFGKKSRVDPGRLNFRLLVILQPAIFRHRLYNGPKMSH